MPNWTLTEAQARKILELGAEIPILAAVLPHRNRGAGRKVYLAVPVRYLAGGYIAVSPAGRNEPAFGQALPPQDWFRVPAREIVAAATETIRRADLLRQFTPIPRERGIIVHPTPSRRWRVPLATAIPPEVRAHFMADLIISGPPADLLRLLDYPRIGRPDPFLSDDPLSPWGVSDEAWEPLIPAPRRVMGVDLGPDSGSVVFGVVPEPGKIVFTRIGRAVEFGVPDQTGTSVAAAAFRNPLEEMARKIFAEAAYPRESIHFTHADPAPAAEITLDDLRRTFEDLRVRFPPPPPLAPPFPSLYDPSPFPFLYEPPSPDPPGESYRPRYPLTESLYGAPAVLRRAAILAYDMGARFVEGWAAAAEAFRPFAPPPAPPLSLGPARVEVRIDRRGKARYITRWQARQ
jgi:hypothetical protein